VERTNLSLATKLLDISRGKWSDVSSPRYNTSPRKYRSPAEKQRREEAYRIATENGFMARKLLSNKSHIEKCELDKDH
jgi:hypothetical protein